MRALVCALLVLCAFSCGNPDGNQTCRLYRSHHYQNQFPGKWRYDVRPDTETSGGIQIDMSGQRFDLEALDRQTDEVEACLRKKFGSTPTIPAEVAGCDGSTFPLPIARECLVVKVAADWIPSMDGSQQLLPAPANPQGCYDKGLCLNPDGTPQPDCPCHYRAGIQDNSVIVVTPNQYLYKDALIRLVTGCNNPWVPALAQCVNPSVSLNDVP